MSKLVPCRSDNDPPFDKLSNGDRHPSVNDDFTNDEQRQRDQETRLEIEIRRNGTFAPVYTRPSIALRMNSGSHAMAVTTNARRLANS